MTQHGTKKNDSNSNTPQDYETMVKNRNIGHIRFRLPGADIIHVNRTVLSMLNYSDTDVLKTMIKDVITTRRTPDSTLFDYIVSDAVTNPIEVPFRKNNGEPLQATVLAVQVNSPVSDEEYLDVVIIDTSEWKNIRRDLQRHKKKLESNVEKRTRELGKTLEKLQETQEQLLLTEKMAALGQLIAGIAHEINSPLSAIRSSVQNIAKVLDQTVRTLPIFFQFLNVEELDYFMFLLEKSVSMQRYYSSREEREFRKKILDFLKKHDIEDAETAAETLIDMRIYSDVNYLVPLFSSKEFHRILHMAGKISGLYRSAEIISTATSQATNVITALKNYSRSDTASTSTYSNIVDGIETVLTLYHNQIKYDVEIVRQYESRPVILCYPEELIHVWMNLINNALYAMNNKGTITLRIKEENNKVLVMVSDTGHGIPEEIRKNIFNPFFTTKPRGEGTGLGLDIVQKIVQKHNGQMVVESVPGSTTFTVILPKYDNKEDQSNSKD